MKITDETRRAWNHSKKQQQKYWDKKKKKKKKRKKETLLICSMKMCICISVKTENTRDARDMPKYFWLSQTYL